MKTVVPSTRTENRKVQIGSAMRHSGRYQINPEAIKTPTDWIKSPMTWMKAALKLISSWWWCSSWSVASAFECLCECGCECEWPKENAKLISKHLLHSAVNLPYIKLIRNPKAAVINIIFPSISSGSLILSTASQTKNAVINQTIAMEAKAPRVWARWKPKVKVAEAARLLTKMATTLVKKPATSKNIKTSSTLSKPMPQYRKVNELRPKWWPKN